jgi:hypothetical protein
MSKIKNLNLNEIAKLVTIKFGDMEQDYRMPWVGEFWLAEDDVGETITFEKYQWPQNGWVTLYVIEDMGAEQVTRWLQYKVARAIKENFLNYIITKPKISGLKNTYRLPKNQI